MPRLNLPARAAACAALLLWLLLLASAASLPAQEVITPSDVEQAAQSVETPAESFTRVLSKHQRVMRPVVDYFANHPVEITLFEDGAGEDKSTVITWQGPWFRQEHSWLGFTEVFASDGEEYWYGSTVNLPYSLDHGRGLDVSLQVALGFNYLQPDFVAHLGPAINVPGWLDGQYEVIMFAPPGMSQVLLLLDKADLRLAGVLQGNERQLASSVQYTLVGMEQWQSFGPCWYPANVVRRVLDPDGNEMRSRVLQTQALQAVEPLPRGWFSREYSPPVSTPNLPEVPYNVPFSFLNDTVVIRCQVAGGHRLRFELDTGANVGLLRSDVARKLGLTPEGDEQVTGHGASVSVGYVRVEGLMLEGQGRDLSVEIPPFPAAVLNENRRLDESLADNGVDGLLGNLFLNNFIVKLDYRRRMLSLYPKGGFDPQQHLGQDYHALPVERDSMPFVQVVVDDVIKGGAFFNSGAQQFFTLNAWAIDTAGMFYSIDRIDTGVTIGGHQAFGIIHPGEVQLGDIVLEEPPTTLEILAPGEAPNPDRIASFGNAFFQHYTVTFDLFDQVYYIEGM